MNSMNLVNSSFSVSLTKSQYPQVFCKNNAHFDCALQKKLQEKNFYFVSKPTEGKFSVSYFNTFTPKRSSRFIPPALIFISPSHQRHPLPTPSIPRHTGSLFHSFSLEPGPAQCLAQGPPPWHPL